VHCLPHKTYIAPRSVSDTSMLLGTSSSIFDLHPSPSDYVLALSTDTPSAQVEIVVACSVTSLWHFDLLCLSFHLIILSLPLTLRVVITSFPSFNRLDHTSSFNTNHHTNHHTRLSSNSTHPNTRFRPTPATYPPTPSTTCRFTLLISHNSSLHPDVARDRYSSILQPSHLHPPPSFCE